jgi:general stress protein 26
MLWSDLVEAAKDIDWVVYLGTADKAGRPHVSVVAPGFQQGAVWFVTRMGSRKYRNLAENPEAGFHWSVGGAGPGELAAWGTASLHEGDDARRRLWASGIMEYDLDSFFGGPDNEEVAFVEVGIRRARLLGPGFRSDVYQG